MSTYKLTYFNTEGRAEPIRLILAQAGVQFEDKRVTKEEWLELKPKTPYGVLPVLEFDGKVLAGSKPIARYLAEKHGLAGSNDFENAEIAGILDVLNDFEMLLGAMYFEKDETRKAALHKELSETHLPRYLGIFEKLITENSREEGWVYGPKVTYADLHFFFITDCLIKFGQSLEKYPGIQKLRNTISSLSNIAKWLKQRPQTNM